MYRAILFLCIALLTTPTNAANIDILLDRLQGNDFGAASAVLKESTRALTASERAKVESFLKQNSPQGDWIPFLKILAGKSDSNADFLFFLSQALWRSGDVDGAVETSGKAIEAAPNNADMVYKCAAIARTLGKTGVAKQRIDAVLKLDAKNPDALFLLGSIYAEEGENEEAKLTLQSVLAAHPRHIRSLYELGKLETRLGNDRQAVEYLQKAVDVYPFFREAYSAMRTSLARLGNKEEFNRVQKLLAYMRNWNPNQYRQLRYMYENAFEIPMDQRETLVRELIAVQKTGRALEYLTNLRERKNLNDSLRMTLAQMHYNDKEFPNCLEILNEIEDESIRDAEPYIGIKAWSLFGVRDAQQSRALYDRYKDRFADSANFNALGKALDGWEADSDSGGDAGSSDQPTGFLFREASKPTGLNAFQHRLGHKDKRWIVDAMGSGVAVADFDNDGDDDIYFVNGRPSLENRDPQWVNRLFRNDGGRFTDVTERAGVGDGGWGMCAIFGDVNNDGWLDLFVGNYGDNVLYVSNGDGTFTDRTEEAGLKHDGYAAAAVFGDLDGDGDLDLYVGNYVEFTPSEHGDLRDRFHGLGVMKGPMGLKHQDDSIYLNDGTGLFTDFSESSQINVSQGRAMGALLTDFDLDGDLDLYVTNDSTYNHMLLNQGNAVFENKSFFSGAAVDESGQEGASMGAATGDYNNDGFPDIYVTAYEQESDILYQNKDGKMFLDMKGPMNLVPLTRWLTTWGTGFCDFDADGFLDIYTVNGHTYPQVEDLQNQRTYPQGVSFYKNKNGQTFTVEDVSFESEDGLAGRGSAVLDYDGDGDMDIVINCIDDSPRLLENHTSQGSWLKVKLIGTSAQTFGVRVVAKGGDKQWTRTVDGGSGYLSQNSQTLHFGFGDLDTIDELTVYWLHHPPTTQTDVKPNQTLQIQSP